MTDQTHSKLIPATRVQAVLVLCLGVIGLTGSATSLRDGTAIIPVLALVLSVFVIALGLRGLTSARRTR
ncbi:hypothetical protein [Streptomyces sp. 8P21H-1]|uniref:hypothetical protein n=1 Tax=Streptomyces sp. 8P21H-1 TaxID=2737048 RepID=UPI00156F24AE|nr:hypothetical protein [Streptomyces sp. 8P21H-1]NSL43331.1 hypothetical protein [Streptomyces sp. 8P21H-1]